MPKLSMDQQLVALAASVAAIHDAANKEFLDPYWFFKANSRWVDYVNEQANKLPNLITFEGQLEKSVQLYVDGLRKIRGERKPLVTFFAGAFATAVGGPWSAVPAVVDLWKTGEVFKNFEKSTPMNETCTTMMLSYTLTSINSGGYAYTRAEWHMMRNGHGEWRSGGGFNATRYKIRVTGEDTYVKV